VEGERRDKEHKHQDQPGRPVRPAIPFRHGAATSGHTTS